MSDAGEGARYLKEFFFLATEWLCVLGADRRIEGLNPALSHALGLTEDEMIGARFLDRVHQEDRDDTEAALAALGESNTTGRVSFRNRYRMEDGSHRSVSWRALRDRDRIYLAGSGDTDHQRTREDHRALASRHEAILSAVPDIIAEVDVNRVYTWVNQAGYDFFGASVIGKEASFFFEGDRGATYRSVQPLFDGSEDTIYVESWQRRQDGEKRLLGWWCRGLKSPEGRVVGALSTARDITDQRRTEDALRDSERRYKALFDNAAQGILSVDRHGRILTANPMALDLFGYELDELIGQTIELLLPEQVRELHARHRDGYFSRPRSRPMGQGLDLVARRKDGSEFPVEISLGYVRGKEDVTAVAFISDISERTRALRDRERLEHRLEHATKMEAVGRLAGGIAHDFNNLLTALSGFAEIALDELPEDHPLYHGAEATFKTCQRSASLVRRLLAVSRRQILQPQVLDLNAKVGEIEKMLRGVLGEDIELSVKLRSRGFVRADESQIEQVLLNLVVNARDAMPTGGRLTIETDDVEIDDVFVAQHIGGKPGPYVRIVVCDTGHGMDEKTLEHIFEPFFTTKDRGKGTGLGLATVYGTVNQSGGLISVYSEPGRGTTFRVYLPRISREGDELVQTARAENRTGSETVLVVEDEDTVRLVAVSNLRKAGYRVVEARDAEEALRLTREHDGKIDLILSDVVMPKMNGPELLRTLSREFPEIRALYMSGHADDALVHHGIVEGGLAFLEKPFTQEELTRAVREVLDSEQTSTR